MPAMELRYRRPIQRLTANNQTLDKAPRGQTPDLHQLPDEDNPNDLPQAVLLDSGLVAQVRSNQGLNQEITAQ